MKHFLKNRLATSLAFLDHLPFCGKVTPPLNLVPGSGKLELHRRAQTLAFQCAEVTAAEIRPGWSEKKTAAFIRAWLSDHGVIHYFHLPLVFFGDRTRFQNFTRLSDLRPSRRVLREDDVFILDFAPIVEGLACDVSITGSTGTVTGYTEAMTLLADIRSQLPGLVKDCGYDGVSVWNNVNNIIEEHGYDTIHRSSPYSFFGHRLNGTDRFPLAKIFAERGKQTYNEFFARGVSGQLWTGFRKSSLYGLWSVEPHIGTDQIGVKFEETLLVSPDFVGWLKDLNLENPVIQTR